jgi:hypothetical protein
MKKVLMLFLSLFLTFNFVRGQDSISVYKKLKTFTKENSQQTFEIKTLDGSEFICRIISFDSSKVKIRTLNGIEAQVPLVNINSVKHYSLKVRNGGFLSDRLFFAPTGNMITAGTLYLNDIQIFFPELFAGVKDFFTVGVGIPLFFYGGIKTFYFTAKISPVSLDKFHAALGGTILAGSNAYLLLPFAVGTMNFEKVSLTFGSMGYYSDNDYEINGLYFYGGGILQLSHRFAIITEDWILDADGIISLGFRYTGDKVGVDLGLFKTVKAPKGNIIPWLGASLKF